MSTSEYKSPEELIEKIKSLAGKVQNVNKITFAHGGEIYFLYTGTLDVEVKVNGEKSRMPLQEFGEKYKAPGLTDLFRAMNKHYAVIQAI